MLRAYLCLSTGPVLRNKTIVYYINNNNIIIYYYYYTIRCHNS